MARETKHMLIAIALGGLLATPAAAQPRVFRGQLILPGQAVDPGADAQQGVYVRDSAIAADKFELAKRMERLKEWYKSADVYQEILEKYQDRVVPVDVNDKGQATKYASVTVAVQQRLCRWPAEGLDVYRTRYEPAAAGILATAKVDDLAALHRVLEYYFATDSGRQAGLRLMDLYLESGEFSAAARIGDRLLQWHPNLTAERPAVQFRTALAYHLAGNGAAAAKQLNDLKTASPDVVGTVAGRDVKLVDALAEQLAQKPPLAIDSAGDSWRTFGGNPSRDLISTATGRPGARIYSIDLFGPDASGPLAPGQARRTGRGRPAAAQAGPDSGSVSVMPVYDRGELFFQDGQRLYAVRVESGLPLAGWQQTYPQASGQYRLPQQADAVAINVPEGVFPQQLRVVRQHSLTLSDDAVVAVMGQPDLQLLFGGGRGGVGAAGTRLVCLDRATGRQRWIADPNTLPNNPGNARNFNFSGSPLVVGNSVYVIARGSSGAAVEDCHVFCYDLESGKYNWSSYIASSQNGAGLAAFGGGGMPVIPGSDTVSHLAFSSGRIFVLTNLGAMAAIDAYSGSTAWLTLYPRDTESLRRSMQVMVNGINSGLIGQNSARPWEFNPVIVSEGKVFALPTDGRDLLIYDADTGNEIQRIPQEAVYGSNTYTIQMLLAVAGEKLFVTGPCRATGSAIAVRGGSPESNNAILCLNWPKCIPQAAGSQKMAPDSLLNANTIAPIVGRPFLTTKYIFLPTADSLFMMDVDVKSGKIVDRFPKVGGWGSGEGGGNVLVTNDHVVIANSRNVSVYTDLSAIRAKYAATIAAEPANVGPRLVFAELMFNAREMDDAANMLDEAIGVLGGVDNMRAGDDRDRVFSDAILFAQKAAEAKKPSGVELAERLFDRAKAAALSPAQQVNYRLSRARFIESLPAAGRQPDWSQAVGLYQEILANPDFRTVMASTPDGVATQAGRAAEIAIKGLMERVGPQVYAAQDKQAAELFKQLSAGGDPEKLLALADDYPNSAAAPQAMMKSAEIYEQRGQARGAGQLLRRLYMRHGAGFSGEQRQQLVEAMARNYLKVDNLPAALGRLQQAIAAQPTARLSAPLVLLDGKPVTTADGKPAQSFKEAAAALQQVVSQQAEVLPDAKIPPPLTLEDRMAKRRREPFAPPNAQSIIPNIRALIEPPADLSSAARRDRIVVSSGDKLMCFEPGETTPRWSVAALADVPAGLAWGPKTVAIWSETELTMLDSDKGTTLWKTAISGLPAVDLVAPPAGGEESAESDNADQPRQVADLDPDQMRAIVLQQRRMGMAVVVRPLPAVVQPAAPVAQAAAPADGRERVLAVRPLSDRVIVSTTMGRVAALDRADGKLLWQTRLSASNAIQQTLCSDDFTMVRLVEGSSAQLVVLDSFDGGQIFRRSTSTSQSNWIQNCVLAPNGTVVWTMPQSLAAKNLFEPGDVPTWERPGGQGNYAGMNQSDQLAIYADQVLAVCTIDNMRFVDRHNLRTGDSIGNVLGTGGGDGAVHLRLAGPRLYVLGGNSLVGYHLTADTAFENRKNTEMTAYPADLMICSDYLVLPSVANGKADNYGLQIYSRALIRNPDDNKLRESGLFTYQYSFTEPTRVKAWQAVDGGIYYLAGDQALHFLKGARE